MAPCRVRSTHTCSRMYRVLRPLFFGSMAVVLIANFIDTPQYLTSYQVLVSWFRIPDTYIQAPLRGEDFE